MRKALTIIGLAVLLLSIILYINQVKDFEIKELRDTPAMAVVEAPVSVPEPEIVPEPTPEPIVQPSSPVEPVQAVVPQPAPQPVVVAGDCASEIAKYDWDYSTAYAVMMAESGGRAWVVNNTPSTGDYSVGCFQINLYGGNARTRPSEAELKDPATNVAFAYRLYAGNGNSFIGQWGVCRSKVSCY